MIPAITPVYLSTIDEQRFGIRVGRASQVTLENLPVILAYCHENAIQMLIARCPTSDLPAAQQMERHGFLLMDTLVYYSRSLEHLPADFLSPPVGVTPIQVRHASPEDADAVKQIAGSAFRSYFGHYHADPRLDPLKCDETYADWAFQSCNSKDVADEVFIAEQDETILGFLTMQLKGPYPESPELGDGILFGVDPLAQGKGVGRALMQHAMQWLISIQVKRMQIPTQLVNLASQMVWSSLGFRLSHSFYTFHKWFDISRS